MCRNIHSSTAHGSLGQHSPRKSDLTGPDTAEEGHTWVRKPPVSLGKPAHTNKEVFTAPFCTTEKTGKCLSEKANCCIHMSECHPRSVYTNNDIHLRIKTLGAFQKSSNRKLLAVGYHFGNVLDSQNNAILLMDPGVCHLRITYRLDTGNSHQRRGSRDRGRTGEREGLALTLTPVFPR